MTVRSGKFVAKHIESINGTITEEDIQPNGLDLSIDKIYKIEGTPRITNDEYDKGQREMLDKKEDKQGEYYRLSNKEAYIVVYGEKIHIPQDHIGLVLPRSRMMRSGTNIQTAVWDSGYEGIGEGGLDVSQPIELNADAKIAQMIFIKSEQKDDIYDGSHQSERV